MTKPDWKLVEEYSVQLYACGLRAGDRLKLKRDLTIRQHPSDTVTGEILSNGHIWTVLPGAKDDPGVVWLRQPDGKRHTWDDDASIFEAFELVDRP